MRRSNTPPTRPASRSTKRAVTRSVACRTGSGAEALLDRRRSHRSVAFLLDARREVEEEERERLLAGVDGRCATGRVAGVDAVGVVDVRVEVHGLAALTFDRLAHGGVHRDEAR